MNLIQDTQRADILRAIVAYPEATIKETQKVVQGLGHQYCAPHHIKGVMEKEGITRERTSGMRGRYVIPQRIVGAVEALNAGTPTVEKTKIDRVWTKPMTKYPGNCRVTRL